MKHRLPTEFLNREVSVELVGCGGTGSHMVSALARIHLSIMALGHPRGLSVTVWDPDEVTEANAGRQLFSASDIGLPKAVCLVERVNRFHGLDWKAARSHYARNYLQPATIIVGCVDNNAGRVQIHKSLEQSNNACYWLDCGNELDSGQVIIGNNHNLPTAGQLFPAILTGKTKTHAPSCSLAAALAKQDLFVNQQVATLAGQLIWRLFRQGGLDYHGFFFNLSTGTTTALPVDAEHWARFGFKYETTSKTKRQR
jgi:PRTRC genetic system ThiF family protein